MQDDSREKGLSVREPVVQRPSVPLPQKWVASYEFTRHSRCQLMKEPVFGWRSVSMVIYWDRRDAYPA